MRRFPVFNSRMVAGLFQPVRHTKRSSHHHYHKGTPFHPPRSSSHGNSHHPPPSSSSSSTIWMAAALGSCVAFQLAAEHWNQIAAMEKEKEPPDENNKESHCNKLPWYRRHPTLMMERLRSSVTTTTSSPEDTNGTVSHSNSTEKELDNRTLFHGQCLERQLYRPPVPYPAWDYNWDGKMNNESTLEVLSTAEGLRNSCMTGTTRHILLIRHGQYEEEPLEDGKRCLTPLGRRQAHLTGRRMASLIQHITETNDCATLGPIYTSDMLRAKQTAWIMAQAMCSSTVLANPDPDLNEGLPAPMIPPRPDLPGVMEEVDEQKERMERAYRKYFYRADNPPKQLLTGALEQSQNVASTGAQDDFYEISSSGTVSNASATTEVPFDEKEKNPSQLPPPDHEFDILVCHGNIIRYFICRALQLPPEAWLRLSVFNCSVSYIIIKPNGYVSCRMIGDIGHLGYKETTFSGAHGLLWS